MMERCTTLDDIPVVVYPDIIHLVLTTSSSVGGHRLILHRRHQHHSTILGSQISQRFIKLMNYKHSGVNHPTTTAYCFFQLCYIVHSHWHHHGSEKWCRHRRNDSGGGSTTSPKLYIRGLIGGEIFFFPFSSLFRKYLLARITKLLVAIVVPRRTIAQAQSPSS